MKKKLLGSDIEPKCQYCLSGTAVTDSDTVLCPKKGVLDKNDSCRKFIYDPLKRIPQQAAEMLSFSADDFSLD